MTDVVGVCRLADVLVEEVLLDGLVLDTVRACRELHGFLDNELDGVGRSG